MYTDFKLNHIYLTLKLSHSSFEWMTKSHVKKKCWDVERVKVKSVTVVPQDYRVWQTTHSYISSLWRSYTFFIYSKFQTLHMLYYSVIADPNLAEIKLPKNFLLCISSDFLLCIQVISWQSVLLMEEAESMEKSENQTCHKSLTN